MNRLPAAFMSGLLFGIGLVVAQMTNPGKIIGFLDITGNWDPSLTLVMAGGLAVFGGAYALSRSRQAPQYSTQFVLPGERAITVPLVSGATLFGVGWALGGLCPGPAVVSAAFGEAKAWMFILAMLAGMQGHHLLTHVQRGQEDPASAVD